MGNLYLGNNRVKPSTCVGINPSGTINITTNGNINVTNYANANVNVQGISPVTIYKGTVDGNGVLTSFNNENDTTTVAYKTPDGKLIFEGFNNIIASGEENSLSESIINFKNDTTITSVDLSNLININNHNCLFRSFLNCTNIKSVNLSSLTSVSGRLAMSCMFYGCTKLKSVNLDSLVSISSTLAFDSIFGSCNLESINLPNLTTIQSLGGSNAFGQGLSYCYNLKHINIDALTTISGSFTMTVFFRNCTNLESVNFKSLNSIQGYRALISAFEDCTKMKHIYFPSLNTSSFGSTYTNQFNNLVENVNGCTIHFPSNMQSTISTLDTYPLFGGTNTILLYDLPATN